MLLYVFLTTFFINTLLAVGLLGYILSESISKKRKRVLIPVFAWSIILAFFSLAIPEIFHLPQHNQEKHDTAPKNDSDVIPPVSKLCVKTTYQSVREEPIVICGEPVAPPQ